MNKVFNSLFGKGTYIYCKEVAFHSRKVYTYTYARKVGARTHARARTHTYTLKFMAKSDLGRRRNVSKFFQIFF